MPNGPHPRSRSNQSDRVILVIRHGQRRVAEKEENRLKMGLPIAASMVSRLGSSWSLRRWRVIVKRSTLPQGEISP
jgi:hypothetical protein